MPREKLGEILIRAGYLTQEGLQQALNEQTRWGGQLGRYLVELGLVSEEILVRALSTQFKVTAVALEPHRVDIKTARLIPQDICERNNLIAFRFDDGKKFIDVAMSDPSNLDAIDEVRVATKLNVRPYIAAPTAVDRAISYVFYGDVAIGGALDLSPDSDLRLDTSSQLQRKARGEAGPPPPPSPDGSTGPAANEIPALDVKVSVSPQTAKPTDVPTPPPPVSLPPTAPPSPPEGKLTSPIELPKPVKDDGFHISMNVPAVDKEALTKKSFEDLLAQLDATVNRNSNLLKELLEALARKGLFTKGEVRRILESANK
jgi:hypothetical protein